MKVPALGTRMWLWKMRYLQEGPLRKASTSPWFLVSSSLYSDTPEKRSKATPLQERRMIDRFRLHVKGGDGGSGSASLRRSRNDRFGKPDGGNGGRGGDVILQCSSAVWDFRGLQHHINGKMGGHGTSKNMVGSRGEDKIVQVPVGTVIHMVEGEIPSAVEKPSKPSSGYVHPWDISGTVTPPDVLGSDQDDPNVNQLEDIVHVSSSCTNDTADKQPYSHVSSIQKGFLCSSRDKSKHKTGVRGVKIGHRCFDEEEHEQEQNQRSMRVTPSQGMGRSAYRQPYLCRQQYPLQVERYEDSFINSYNEDNCDAMEEDDYDMEIGSDRSDKDWAEDMENIQYNVAELTEERQQLIVACGGDGGLGSVSSGRHFKKDIGEASIEGDADGNQPSIRAGLPGSQALLILELKSIADVGLVGMPNAGKSTLLGAISRAKPVVGHYAFTTLRPNIGKLNFDELSVTVADIPGLIKGAHENRGLGHAFLRHIERTKILAFVVDLAAALDGRKGTPPWEQLKDLVLELEHYQEGLSDRPSLVVANKIDEAGAEEVYEELQRRVRGIPIYPVCAVLEEGVPEVKAGLRMLANGEELGRLRLENILID